ncbi:cyclic GMP-AMP synthase-like [Mytilus edulis]|uniref:cyclic GMP-AMP synthase-like n=1 Tax=Mytilus edulis TaxID=6550 RepID=UPI0039EEBCB5
MSICLYEYLCLDIVGSEDYVRLIRLINASNDSLDSQKFISRITSGSFGEGLELEGSDLDIMIVPHLLEVTDQTKKQDYYYPKNYFLSDTDDVKPGFAYLRLMKGNTIKKNLLYRGVDGQLFLSSVLLKQQFLNKGLPVVHGPCVSDETGRFDIAICPHSKSWITTASKWVTRSNKSWPTDEVKLRVINHGVLFVPIGTGGNLNEELKWRISFSVGEKFLIYSFNHTQLLCYALMKILLKDIISKSPGCKDLLCSYFIKTILFWISEEIPILVWTPDNLIPCFMRCFKRLMYCVEQSMCPHYFIPENNLFENKIIEQGRIRLLKTLCLIPKSCLIPDELKLYAHNVSGALPVPPVVYLHFLKYLCHYHLDNVRNYQESLGDLHLTIEENYFISERFMKAGAYDCLGIAFLVVGDRDSARAAFGKSKELNPDQTENWSYKRLAMMDKRDN